jgi:prepilin-type N-terminal cleavage/methylation domain-containing protein
MNVKELKTSETYMKMRRTKMTTRTRRGLRDERGFSVVELLIVICVIVVLATIALMGIRQAEQNARRIDTARALQSYLETARADAVRRHDAATVQVINASSYRIVMDFNNNGVIDAGEARIIKLPFDVRFAQPFPSPATFDWRGRLAGDINFTLLTVSSSGRAIEGRQSSSLSLTSAGDIANDTHVGNQLPHVDVTPFPTPIPATTPTPQPTAIPITG